MGIDWKVPFKYALITAGCLLVLREQSLRATLKLCGTTT